MPPEPFNPYAPPAAFRPKPTTPGRGRRWAEVAVRAVAVVLGFSLVADPTAISGPLNDAIGGHVFVRAVGLALLALGFFPWPGRRRVGSPGAEMMAEDL